jgi:hypothetical protein
MMSKEDMYKIILEFGGCNEQFCKSCPFKIDNGLCSLHLELIDMYKMQHGNLIFNEYEMVRSELKREYCTNKLMEIRRRKLERILNDNILN